MFFSGNLTYSITMQRKANEENLELRYAIWVYSFRSS